MAGFGHDEPDRGPLIVAELAIAADPTDQPVRFLAGEPFQPAAFGSAFVLLLSGAAAGCS